MFALPTQEQMQETKKPILQQNVYRTMSPPNATGIPNQMKAQFEQLSGYSFHDVRVHYNSNKPAQLNAFAYTQGNQVYVASGQERHLGHELGHVVQQKQGRVRPTRSVASVPVNDDIALEKEADEFSVVVQGMFRPRRESSLREIEKQGTAVVQRVEKQVKELRIDAGFATKHLVTAAQLDEPIGNRFSGISERTTKIFVTSEALLLSLNHDRTVTLLPEIRGKATRFRCIRTLPCATSSRIPARVAGELTESWAKIKANQWRTQKKLRLEGNYEPFDARSNQGINIVDHYGGEN